MRTLFLIVLFLTPCISFDDDYNELYYERYKHLRQKKPPKGKTKKPKEQRLVTVAPATANMSISYFPMIFNNQSKATQLKDTDTTYQWIASVYHSPTGSYLCSAACIEERIFITAARCIADALVVFTHVMYKNTKLKPIAIVIPTKPTKQMFDDIGFIIVDKNFKGKWQNIGVTDKWKRTDDNFSWFGKVPIFKGIAIGHVAKPEKGKEVVTLYKIDVHVSNYLCYYLYNRGPLATGTGYFVPCYHTCTLEQDHYRKNECMRYLAGEGHIVLDEKSKIVGVATWGPGKNNLKYGEGKDRKTLEMPIGMAIPNSKSFSEDFNCAKKIKQAAASTKSYASLC